LVVISTELASELLLALILAVVLIRTEWRMALLLFAFMPVIVAMTLGFRSLARRVTRQGMQAMADVNSAIKETVSGFHWNFRQKNHLPDLIPLISSPTAERAARLVLAGLPCAQRGRRRFHRHPGLRRRPQHHAGIITFGAWYLHPRSDQFFFPVQLSAFWAQIQQGLSAAERGMR
jgi:ATP-binding cassette subfamily B protein